MLGDNVWQRPVRRAGFLACLEECCKVADAADVIILLEPLNRYECDYLNRLEDALNIIKDLDMPNKYQTAG